jgi:phosphoribosylpyrophosphate synthetase
MTLCRFFSATPLTMSGPACLVMFDLHELAIRFQLRDNLIPVLLSGQSCLLDHLAHNFDLAKENFVAIFPDAGSAKRYSNEYKNFDVVFCVKVCFFHFFYLLYFTIISFRFLLQERKGDKRVITIEKGIDLTDRNCLIVDDLIQSGGTILETIKVVNRCNARSVGVMVTHPVFPNESWKKFTDAGLRFFYTCNTVPHTVERISGREPFTVVSFVKTFAKFLNMFK